MNFIEINHIKLKMTSTNNIEIYNFQNKTIRITGDHDKPWFVVKDVCDVLEISNVAQVLKNIPEKWKGISKTYTLKGNQDMGIVNEAGLYKIILRSNKPQAQPFQEWVCEVVLPTIHNSFLPYSFL